MIGIGGNYWMNLVKLDELVDQLFLHFRPLLNNEYSSEDEALLDIYYHRMDFFLQRPQYKLFNIFINIDCVFVVSKLPIRYTLDSIIIVKLV